MKPTFEAYIAWAKQNGLKAGTLTALHKYFQHIQASGNYALYTNGSRN